MTNLQDAAKKSPCSGEGATHHFACACREAHFAKLEAELEALKKEIALGRFVYKGRGVYTWQMFARGFDPMAISKKATRYGGSNKYLYTHRAVLFRIEELGGGE